MNNIVQLLIIGVLLFIVYYLLKFLWLGALHLLAWATESGFIGVAAYVACWVFLFPFMLGGSILAGVKVWWDNR